MSIIAGIAIDAEAFVIGQILSATTTRIDLTQFVPVDGRLSPYFWKERGGDRVRIHRVTDHVRTNLAVLEAFGSDVSLEGTSDEEPSVAESDDGVTLAATPLHHGA